MESQPFRRKSNLRASGRRRSAEAGLTLIELMITAVVLGVGLAGVAVMMTTAMATNSRNRLDTGATMLAQTVLEKITAVPATSNATITITDCNPGGAQTFAINTQDGAATSGAGAQLTSSGDIDYTQAASSVPAGYRMTYYTCGTGGRSVPYDVRWNVMTGNTLSGSTYTKLVTVSARQLAPTGGNYRGLYYAPPATLRGFEGQ